MKKVIAACIDRIFEFDSQEEAAAYIEKLRSLEKTFPHCPAGRCRE